MINGKTIKVCGMRRAENIQCVEAIPSIDMLGFIFYPLSSRYVREIPSYLPIRARRVGVFVNETESTLLSYVRQFELDYVQLHGNESPDYCRSLRSIGLKIIKVFSIADPADLNETAPYEKACDLFLFDTKCAQYGGSGQSFDWEILQNYQGDVPFLLSGGIGPDSLDALKLFTHPNLIGYDLNSCFELEPAEKDVTRIQAFLNEF